MDALYNAAKPRVVAIGGPTATGKTALSVALAKRFGGEIISADSMQIYQGLDVGTAKVTPEEMQGVPHHLVGFLAPEQAFSVADFTTLAGKTITQLTAQQRNEARRLTWLIDVFYDYRVKLCATSQVEAAEIYVEGSFAEEFKRTVSRMVEMESTSYLSLPHLSLGNNKN